MKKVIIGTRRSGKTKALVEMSSQQNIPIVCRTSTQAAVVRETAGKLGLTIPEPRVYGMSVMRGLKEVLLEDIESFPSFPEQVTVYGGTLTSDEIITLNGSPPVHDQKSPPVRPVEPCILDTS